MSSSPNDPTIDPSTTGNAPVDISTADTPAVDQPNPTVEQLEADRAATRERLAASVEALVAKTDVKGQAKAKATETADQVKSGAEDVLEQVRQLPPAVLAAVAIGVTLVAIVLIRRRRLS
jgi:hypothetical protein